MFIKLLNHKVQSGTCHFLTLQSADKDQQESRAVAEKPHDAVVKFDTYWNLQQITASSRGSPCDSTASCSSLSTHTCRRLQNFWTHWHSGFWSRSFQIICSVLRNSTSSDRNLVAVVWSLSAREFFSSIALCWCLGQYWGLRPRSIWQDC